MVHGNLPSTKLIEVAGFAVEDPKKFDYRLYADKHMSSSGVTSDHITFAQIAAAIA